MKRRLNSCWMPAVALGTLLCTQAGVNAQSPGAPMLTNDDVIKMVEAKLGDSVVVSKIKAAPGKFDTSTDALIKLKQAGVSDAILQAMAEAGTAAPTPATGAIAPAPDPNDPLSPHDPGIYYLRQSSAGRQMIALGPTAYAGEKTGGMIGNITTGGLRGIKYKIAVQGNEAPLRLTEVRPTFYFYFDEKPGGFGNSGFTSPSDLALLRMHKKKKQRELVVGGAGITGLHSGVRQQDMVTYETQKLARGVYKVQPNNSLETGEYCFFDSRSGQTLGWTGGRLFDFGVSPAQ